MSLTEINKENNRYRLIYSIDSVCPIEIQFRNTNTNKWLVLYNKDTFYPEHIPSSLYPENNLMEEYFIKGWITSDLLDNNCLTKYEIILNNEHLPIKVNISSEYHTPEVEYIPPPPPTPKEIIDLVTSEEDKQRPATNKEEESELEEEGELEEEEFELSERAVPVPEWLVAVCEDADEPRKIRNEGYNNEKESEVLEYGAIYDEVISWPEDTYFYTDVFKETPTGKIESSLPLSKPIIIGKNSSYPDVKYTAIIEHCQVIVKRGEDSDWFLYALQRDSIHLENEDISKVLIENSEEMGTLWDRGGPFNKEGYYTILLKFK